jgi:hypothetical protein
MESENYLNSNSNSNMQPQSENSLHPESDCSSENLPSNHYNNLYDQISDKISHLPQGEYSAEASLLIKEIVQKFSEMSQTTNEIHFHFPGSLHTSSF